MTEDTRGNVKGKGRIRSLSRKGSRSDQSPRVVARTAAPPQSSMCERCGAVFSRRTWRRDRPISDTLLGRARWTVCPSCRQVQEGEYFGRVLIRGTFVDANEEAIRHRIDNVAARAGVTQPERRLISVSRQGTELEVLTTSQKLAHRIVRELTKAFRGRASYAWSDKDGALFATWQRDATAATTRRRG
jgi:NMD protein affecting ribosome stability and mRNA decay